MTVAAFDSQIAETLELLNHLRAERSRFITDLAPHAIGQEFTVPSTGPKVWKVEKIEAHHKSPQVVEWCRFKTSRGSWSRGLTPHFTTVER